MTRINASSIVVYCLNYGKVQVKKQQAGGIAGLQELGLIYGCESYGNIAAAGGKYVGGLAGNSARRFRSPMSAVKVEGKDFVGGIAGSGTTPMEQNIAMPFVQALGEGVGAVAGEAAEGGTIAKNYYVNDDYGAVDDISYAGAARACFLRRADHLAADSGRISSGDGYL